MPHLTRISFARDGEQYELLIDFDDGDIVDDRLTFELRARVQSEYTEASREVTVTLVIDFERRIATVALPDGSEHEINIAGLDPGINEYDEEIVLDQEDELGDRVAEGIAPALLEALGDVPLGDPLACLVKAGVSSIIGQAVVCRNVAAPGFQGMLRCLRGHVTGIFGRTLWRTARCILFA